MRPTSGDARFIAATLLALAFAMLLTIPAGASVPATAPLAPPFLEPDDGIAASNEYLDVGKNETRIRLRGTAGSGTTIANVLFRVEGKGDAEAYVKPQQTFLIIDDSGSMKVNDPTGVRIQAAIQYVQQIKVDDELGLVKFSDQARTLSRLTNDKAFLEGQLNTQFANDGATNMWDALRRANPEMRADQKATHTHNYILLTDGCWNEGGDPQPEVNVALSIGVRIFTIGLGTDTGNCWTGLDSRDLRAWADQTGGRYYAAPEAKDLYAIYKQIAKDIRDVAGYASTTEPMVVIKVMGDIEVVPSSFMVNGQARAPDSPIDIPVGNKGLNLVWEKPVSRLRVGERMDIVFAIQSYRKGDDIPVNDPLISVLTYTKPDSSTATGVFPPLQVDVYEETGEPGPGPGPGPGPLPIPPGWYEGWAPMALPLFPFALIAAVIALALILLKRRNKKRMEKALRELQARDTAAQAAKADVKSPFGTKTSAIDLKPIATGPVIPATYSKVKGSVAQRAAAKQAAMKKGPLRR